MTDRPRRRDILKAAAGGAALAAPLGAPWGAFAQEAAGAALSAEQLPGGLIAVRGAGGAVVAGAEADGLVLVDGGAKEHSVALLEYLARETGQDRVKTLFNTHWHLEQTGSNETVGAAGGNIVAHENTRLWLSHDFHLWWQNRDYQARPAEALPTETIYDHGTAPFGGGQIEFGYMLQSHTDGDIYVRFPEANVIASGGVGVSDTWPVIDWGTGGWIGGVLDGLAVLIEASDDETLIVPAHGPTIRKADLVEQHEMYTTITARLAELMRKSYGFADVLAAEPTAEFNDRWGDPEQFITLAYRSIWGHIRNDRRVSTI